MIAGLLLLVLVVQSVTFDVKEPARVITPFASKCCAPQNIQSVPVNDPSKGVEAMRFRINPRGLSAESLIPITGFVRNVGLGGNVHVHVGDFAGSQLAPDYVAIGPTRCVWPRHGERSLRSQQHEECALDTRRSVANVGHVELTDYRFSVVDQREVSCERPTPGCFDIDIPNAQLRPMRSVELISTKPNLASQQNALGETNGRENNSKDRDDNGGAGLCFLCDFARRLWWAYGLGAIMGGVCAWALLRKPQPKQRQCK